MDTSCSDRLLRPGVNFTNRGELKFARAVHLSNELRGRIDEWAAAETLFARPRQIDGRTVEFRLVLRRDPPIEEWSLILGDALHNFRSMLDNVVWALATLDDAVPRVPTQVSFPITTDEGAWRKRIQTLESIPVDLLERLRLIQPWEGGVDCESSLLWLLHQFDIIDKHRGLIATSLHFKRLLVGGYDLGHESVEALDAASLSIETRQTPAPFEDESLLVTIRSNSQPLVADPNYRARVDAQFALAVDETRLLLLDSFIRDLALRAREWLDVIYGGTEFAKYQIVSRQADGSTVSYGHIDERGVPRLVQIPMVVASAVQ